MKKAVELLARLREQDIKLVLNGDDLDVISYKHQLTLDQIQSIKLCKQDIITYLKTIDKNESFSSLIPTVETSSSYSLSSAQRRLWLASQIEDRSIAYNIPSTVILDGSYDLVELGRSIDSVIDRHEILRTVFKVDSQGDIRQYILSSDEFSFSIDYKDYRHDDSPEDSANAYISLDSQQAFDLSKGPLLRASLLQVDEDKFIFYFNLHHIISDGWSMDILFGEVMSYYKAYVSGTTPDLAPLRIQYKDYVSWQLSQLEGDQSRLDAQYWVSQFNEGVPLLTLPTENTRPSSKTYSGGRIAARLSPETTSKLRAFTSENKGSLFMGLLAVLKVLLYRYTGERDITIGNPVVGRDHLDLKDQIGFYVNVVALRNALDPQVSFATFFNQIKDNTLEAYDHQMYPFDELLEAVDVRTDPGRSPLFDILVDYHGVSSEGLDFDNDDDIQDLGSGLVKFDLEFDPTEFNDGVDLLFAYNSDVYDHTMVEGFITHYKRLLEVFLDHPESLLGDVDFLLPSDKECRFTEPLVTSLTVPSNQTIVDLFVDQAQRNPDALAVVYQDISLSYGDLDKISNRLARYLQSQGIGRDSLVPICVDRPIDMIVGILGVLKSGGAYVPIDSDCPDQRLSFILEDISCTQVITDSNLASMFETDLGVVCIDDHTDFLSGFSDSSLPTEILSDQLVYVIYTSGTTGVPKGVMITHGNLTDYLFGFKNKLAIDSAYSYGLMSTPSADLGNTVLFSSLSTGGVLHTFSKSTLMNSHDLLSYFDMHSIDIIKMVPSHWLSLSNGDTILLPHRAVIFGGEVLSTEVIDKIRFSSRSIAVFNHYGPTETTIGKLMFKVDLSQDYVHVPLGVPFSNTGVYVLDDQQQLVPVGVAGELYVEGFGLARGYLNRPDLTSEKFIAHPFKSGDRLYRTGDLVKQLSDGNIRFLGRKDNQVKIRGYRIELEEIESVLNKLGNIEQSAVLALDANDSKHLVAYIVSREFADSNSIKEGLMLILEEELPEYMVPTIYIKLDQLPLTSNGKIDRKALPVPDIFCKQEEYIAPSTPTEVRLAQIWQEVLGIEQIGINDDFFALGGNSLKAIRINSEVRKSLNLNIEIKNLFLYKTIAELAFQIDFSTRQEEIKLDNKRLKKIEL